MRNREEFVGRVFHFWTVISEHPTPKGKMRKVLCRCECGTIRPCVAADLKRGHSKSCGCHQKAVVSSVMGTHRLTNTTTYRSWGNMKARCLRTTHPRYMDYGGRGITVCDRWANSFEAFVEDMGHAMPGESIERRDNDRGYCPDNCHWLPRPSQNRNTRASARLTVNGVTKIIADWSRKTGIRATLISRRKRLGWTDHEAVMTPVNRSNKLVTLRRHAKNPAYATSVR